MRPSEMIYTGQRPHSADTPYEMGYLMARADRAAGYRLTPDEVTEVFALDPDIAEGYGDYWSDVALLHL